MSKPFLPRRWCEWAAALFLTLFLAAVFYPVTAYSGPGISHGRVAYDMGNQFRLTSHWPIDERHHELTRVPRFHSYAYRLQEAFTDPKLPKPFVHAAVYRIVVDGKAEIWRANETGKPQRLSVE